MSKLVGESILAKAEVNGIYWARDKKHDIKYSKRGEDGKNVYRLRHIGSKGKQDKNLYWWLDDKTKWFYKCDDHW